MDISEPGHSQNGCGSAVDHCGMTRACSARQRLGPQVREAGGACGEDALLEVMPTVNSSGPGRLPSLAQTMRTPGGLTAQVRAPSTGEVSDTQLRQIARRPGMTPEQLQTAVAGLRTQAGAMSRLVRENLAEGVTLTQAQHAA